jgi:hypothetical protein
MRSRFVVPALTSSIIMSIENPCARRIALVALAAGLPTIFQDREDVAAGGFGSYRLCQRHTSLEVRQLFMAGPDDEQVEAPTFLRGDPLRITEGGRYV